MLSSAFATGKRWRKFSCSKRSEEEKLNDLLEAAREGNEEIIQLLIEQGNVDVNGVPEEEKKGQGMSALHLAVRHNHLDCVKLLIRCGADVNITDMFGFRPIHDASLYGYIDCLKELLDNGALISGVDMHNLDYVSPLYYAVKENCIECMELLQRYSKNPEECDRMVWKLGATKHNTAMLSYTKINNFSKSDSKKWLQCSAVDGNIEYFKKMKECQLKLSPENMKKQKELEFIRAYGFLVIIATQHGHSNYLRTLLRANFDANACNEKQSSALHYAARYGHVESMKLLLKHGAKVDAKNVDNWSPLHVAVKHNHIDAIKELIKCGCDVNLQGGEIKDTALHIALKVSIDVETLKAILAARPSLVMKNDKQLFPIDLIDKTNRLYEVLMEHVRN